MTLLDHGDSILPAGFGADACDVRASQGKLIVELRSDDGANVRLEAEGVIAFRCSYEQVYDDYVEGSLDTVLILEQPRWKVRAHEKETPLGDYVSEARFYHLNIPDVGIIVECWAASISRFPG